MTKISFVDNGGTTRDVDVADGLSLMEAAVTNMVPGIDGDCGGACACATCHVHVEAAWMDKLTPADAIETSMLELCEGVNETSRLGCQINISPMIEGLVVHTPVAQH